MEKAINSFGLGICFIFVASIALILSAIFKRKPSNIECLYLGTLCLAGLAFVFAGIFFMGKFIR